MIFVYTSFYPNAAVGSKNIDFKIWNFWPNQFVTEVRVYNSYFEFDKIRLVTGQRTPFLSLII